MRACGAKSVLNASSFCGVTSNVWSCFKSSSFVVVSFAFVPFEFEFFFSSSSFVVAFVAFVVVAVVEGTTPFGGTNSWAEGVNGMCSCRYGGGRNNTFWRHEFLGRGR